MKDKRDKRRDDILQAAAELFFTRGFAATSIDALIDKVGGSKRTIYALFGNKAALFEAIVQNNTQEVFEDMQPEDHTPRPIDETLERFAVRLLELLSRPRTVAIYRMVASETARFPDLGRTYYELGPQRARKWLAKVLQEAQEAGTICVADPDLAADQFLGLVRGDLLQELIMAVHAPLSSDDIQHRAKIATDVFLNGVRVRDHGQPDRS